MTTTLKPVDDYDDLELAMIKLAELQGMLECLQEKIKLSTSQVDRKRLSNAILESTMMLNKYKKEIRNKAYN